MYSNTLKIESLPREAYMYSNTLKIESLPRQAYHYVSIYSDLDCFNILQNGKILLYMH